MRKKIIVISGPTAVGKSQVGVNVALKLNSEIISCDSVQVYKYLNIGSGKIKTNEMQGVKHHMIDIVNPDMDYNIFDYRNDANICLKDIFNKNKIPIIVGGTAFYINALIYNNDFIEEKKDTKYLSKLQNMDEELLYQLLKEKDNEYFLTVEKNNTKRIIRALEFLHNTGMKFSDYNNYLKNQTSPYEFYYYVLYNDRNILYDKINSRVDKMISDGLVDEVKALNSKGYNLNHKAMNSIGYLEIGRYLNGEIDLNNAIDLIKQNSRHYAKRQLTWFRSKDYIKWINVKNLSELEITDTIINNIKKDEYE